jgi:hypothetical protein
MQVDKIEKKAWCGNRRFASRTDLSAPDSLEAFVHPTLIVSRLPRYGNDRRRRRSSASHLPD